MKLQVLTLEADKVHLNSTIKSLKDEVKTLTKEAKFHNEKEQTFQKTETELSQQVLILKTKCQELKAKKASVQSMMLHYKNQCKKYEVLEGKYTKIME